MTLNYAFPDNIRSLYYFLCLSACIHLTIWDCKLSWASRIVSYETFQNMKNGMVSHIEHQNCRYDAVSSLMFPIFVKSDIKSCVLCFGWMHLVYFLSYSSNKCEIFRSLLLFDHGHACLFKHVHYWYYIPCYPFYFMISSISWWGIYI